MADMRKRLAETAPQPGRYITEEGIAFGPCLLISRECGSGGAQLAEEIGRKTTWNVFDSKIVDEIANINHIHQRLVHNVDERIHSRWEQTWRELLLDDLPDKKYVQDLREVILTLGHHGNVVLVGRGAQFFLPSQCALRVRLVAPRDQRASRLAKLAGLSYPESYVKVERIDSERRDFIRKVFRKDIGSALNHDLIINTGKFGMEQAVNLVLAAIKKKLDVNPCQRPAVNALAAGPGNRSFAMPAD
jgi:hypothetical protein